MNLYPTFSYINIPRCVFDYFSLDVLEYISQFSRHREVAEYLIEKYNINLGYFNENISLECFVKNYKDEVKIPFIHMVGNQDIVLYLAKEYIKKERSSDISDILRFSDCEKDIAKYLYDRTIYAKRLILSQFANINSIIPELIKNENITLLKHVIDSHWSSFYRGMAKDGLSEIYGKQK